MIIGSPGHLTGSGSPFAACLADCQSQGARWNSVVMKSDGSSPLVLVEMGASFTWQP